MKFKLEMGVQVNTFAYQHTNIVPDVMTTAKGLGNGFNWGGGDDPG